MGIIALVSQIEELADPILDMLKKLIEHLDPDEIEAKMSGVVGDVGLKAAKYSGEDKRVNLSRADEIQQQKSTEQLDPSSIDIGDFLRGEIDKKVEAWKEKQYSRLSNNVSGDEMQGMLDNTLGSAVIEHKARLIREQMVENVQSAMAKDLAAQQATQEKQFADLSELREQLLAKRDEPAIAPSKGPSL